MKNIIYTLPKPFNVTVTVNDGSGHIDSTLAKDKIFTKKEADIIEFLILAHACAGIDVSSPQYVEGILTLGDTLANQ